MIISANGQTFESDNAELAINEAIRSFGTVDFDTGDFTPGDIEDVRAWAIDFTNLSAGQREQSIDATYNRHLARNMFLNTEIVDYNNEGRPADPNPARYEIANARAMRRGIPLRDMLEILRDKWISNRSLLATLDADLDEAITAIQDAATIEEIQTILEAVAAW